MSKAGSSGHQPGTSTDATPAAVAGYRQRLSRGEDVVDPGDLGRVPSGRPWHRAAGSGGPGQVVQPAVAAADRLGVADRRGGRRAGAAEHAVGAAVHGPLPRDADLSGGPSGAAVVGGRAALPQRAVHDLHHPGRAADPGRSRPAVLDPALHPGPGLVPVPETGPGGPAVVDRQAGLGQPARPGRPARAAAFHRAGPLVAPGHRHAVAAQRGHLLRAAVLHRAVAADRPHHLGRVPQRGVGAHPVPVAALADRERLDRLQQPAVARLLHHGVRGRTAGADHRTGDVPGAVDPDQAGQPDAVHPGRPVAALPGPDAGSCFSSSSTSPWCSPPGCCAT